MPGNARATTDAELMRLIYDARQLHVALLNRAVGLRSTTGSCFYACILLKTSLEHFTSFGAVVRGGGLANNTGYFDGREWLGHYWLEASTERGPLVVDLTADQFGAEPVVILPLAASAGRYRPDEQRIVDAQVAKFCAELEADRAARDDG